MDRAAAAVAKLEANHAAMLAMPAVEVDGRSDPMVHYEEMDALVGQGRVAKEELVRQQGLLLQVERETAPWLEAYASAGS